MPAPAQNKNLTTRLDAKVKDEAERLFAKPRHDAFRRNEHLPSPGARRDGLAKPVVRRVVGVRGDDVGGAAGSFLRDTLQPSRGIVGIDMFRPVRVLG